MSLISSVILNIILLTYVIINNYKGQLSWTLRAAKEAELIASISCSGHGRAYLDGFVGDNDDEDGNGKPVCECNACFIGSDCSKFLPNCSADAEDGNPLFLEPFWMEHAASSAVLIAGWHRMSYVFPDDSYISIELKKQIFKLHAIVGNAITAGKFIVFGPGSIHLLNAAVHALSQHNSSSPSRVAVSIPFYPAYEEQTNFFDSVDYKFYGDTSTWKNTSSDVSVNTIEFVTSPNNPDCQLKNAVLQGQSVKAIHDHAYYWPHFTEIPTPANEDLMVFTLSKLTGHAGTRFGWALVKDEGVYERMLEYIEESMMGVSRDTQLRALTLLKAVNLEGDGREIFNFGHKTMRTRWEKLSNVISLSKRFSLQDMAPQYCNFFRRVREPSPAYAWLKCEVGEDEDCYEILRAASIISRSGKLFGSDNRHTRLSLIRSQDDFDILMQRLQNLVAGENAPIAIV